MRTALHADRFAPLPPALAARWETFPTFQDGVYFPGLVGLVLEEVRTDYARMRLPYRPELDQPARVVHGGAIATLIDTAVVPAIGAVHPERRALFTINMQVQYLEPVIREDAVAEAWVEKRGRSTVFCRVEVRTAAGALASTGAVVYKVSTRPLGQAAG
jgi:uncharacterized protein (TIGR00369 family)